MIYMMIFFYKIILFEYITFLFYFKIEIMPSILQLTLILVAISFAILSQGPPMFFEAAVFASILPVFVVEIAVLTLELRLTNQAMVSTAIIETSSQKLKSVSLDLLDICHFENMGVVVWVPSSSMLFESTVVLSQICRNL